VLPRSSQRRRALSALAAVACLALDRRAALASSQPKRVAILRESAGGTAELAREFERHGFGAGSLEVRVFAHGKGDWDEVVPPLVAELLRWRPDCIIVPAEYFVRYILRATRTVPIVTNASDPVRLGLATSLARPGGNVTGVYTDPAELHVKQIQLFRTLVPKLRCVAWISFEPRLADYPVFEKAAQAAGVRAHSIVIDPADGYERLAREVRALRAEGCFAAHLLTNVPPAVEAVAKAALQERIVVSYGGDQEENLALEGLLFSFAPAFQVRGYENNSRMVAITARILRGERPEDIPFEGAIGNRLRVNARTAKRLEIALPPELLLVADEVLR
jgi:putative tryptophan/tyrosine transport system substrate-binding protein